MKSRYVVERRDHAGGDVFDAVAGRGLGRAVASCARLQDAVKIADALNANQEAQRVALNLSVTRAFITEAISPLGMAYGSGQSLRFDGFQRHGLIQAARVRGIQIG